MIIKKASLNDFINILNIFKSATEKMKNSATQKVQYISQCNQ